MGEEAQKAASINYVTKIDISSEHYGSITVRIWGIKDLSFILPLCREAIEPRIFAERIIEHHLVDPETPTEKVQAWDDIFLLEVVSRWWSLCRQLDKEPLPITSFDEFRQAVVNKAATHNDQARRVSGLQHSNSNDFGISVLPKDIGLVRIDSHMALLNDVAFPSHSKLVENSAFKQIMKAVEQQHTVSRAALGPLNDLQRAGLIGSHYLRDIELLHKMFADSSLQRGIELAQRAVASSALHRDMGLAQKAFADSPLQRSIQLAEKALADFPLRRDIALAQSAFADIQTRFRLPEAMETARLVAKFRLEPVAEKFAKYADRWIGLQKAMDGIQTPWIDAQKAFGSISGFAQMQGIGHALSNMPTFDVGVTEALRDELGDWRDRITWPSEIFTDLTARADFYVNLGFDPAITDFPAPAFEESLRITGLRRDPPPLIDRYRAPVPRSTDSDEEESLARTNTAHDWLLRLETQLRRFIDEKMTRAFGSEWPKHRLPKTTYDAWHDKKRVGQRDGGREWPLISYADFTDYELVICKRDNWKEVFASFFRTPESVRESFQRLYPVRLCTMHARPITQDDELLLYVETRRFIKIILDS